MSELISIVTFILGCLVGWFCNHWYSVVMKRPELAVNGSGSSSSLYNSNYSSVTVSVTNHLRALAIVLPETVVLGKRFKTHFGAHVIDRDPAQQCRAALLDESGEHISHLWWNNAGKVTEIITIKSGESANLLLFIREASNTERYFAYQPRSQADPTPKISGTPEFKTTMNFIVEISYTHGTQRLRIPVRVVKKYDGSLYFEYSAVRSSGSSRFGQ